MRMILPDATALLLGVAAGCTQQQPAAPGTAQAGALAGEYGGATAQGTAGVGVGANVRLGGSNNQITLRRVIWLLLPPSRTLAPTPTPAVPCAVAPPYSPASAPACAVPGAAGCCCVQPAATPSSRAVASGRIMRMVSPLSWVGEVRGRWRSSDNRGAVR